MRKNKEIGKSFQFQTDGCQAILQYIDIVTVEQKGTVEAAEKRIAFDAKIQTKMNQWREEGKVKPRPKYQVITEKKIAPSEKNFINETDGLFSQKRLETRRRRQRQNLPKIIGIDYRSRTKSIWCTTLYNNDIGMDEND